MCLQTKVSLRPDGLTYFPAIILLDQECRNKYTELFSVRRSIGIAWPGAYLIVDTRPEPRASLIFSRTERPCKYTRASDVYGTTTKLPATGQYIGNVHGFNGLIVALNIAIQVHQTTGIGRYNVISAGA